jgi:hypothetical protein
MDKSTRAASERKRRMSQSVQPWGAGRATATDPKSHRAAAKTPRTKKAPRMTAVPTAHHLSPLLGVIAALDLNQTASITGRAMNTRNLMSRLAAPDTVAPDVTSVSAWPANERTYKTQRKIAAKSAILA